jgi:MFS family permease
MTHDPYAPPSSNIEVSNTKRGSAIKAVVLGLLADLGGSTVIGAAIMFGYGVYLAATGSSPDQAAATIDGFGYDSPLVIVLTIIGCVFSVLGGYICARIARHSEYRLGLIMCAISIALAALLGNERDSANMNVVLTLTTLVSIMVGIHLGVRKNRRGTADPART